MRFHFISQECYKARLRKSLFCLAVHNRPCLHPPVISSLKPQPFLQTPPQLSSSSTILSPEVLPLPPVAHPHKSLLQVDVLLLFPLVWFTDCGMQCQRRFFPRICVDSFGQFKNGCDVEVSGGGDCSVPPLQQSADKPPLQGCNSLLYRRRCQSARVDEGGEEAALCTATLSFSRRCYHWLNYDG